MLPDEDSDDLDAIELGERVAKWLLFEELGAAYSTLSDRSWAVAVGCSIKCAWSLGPDNVPPEWQPVFDEHGRWAGAQDTA